jgi:hypothetical protein
MKNELIITTNQPSLHYFFNADIPEGVKIISDPPIERRGIDWNIIINVDITLAIDLTKITALAFALWLFKHIRRPQREIEIKINRKQIPIDQSEAIKFITTEIEHEQKNDDKD